MCKVLPSVPVLPVHTEQVPGLATEQRGVAEVLPGWTASLAQQTSCGRV